MEAILEALGGSRYGLTIGAGLVVLILLLIYTVVTVLGKNKKNKAATQDGRGGQAASHGGMGTTGDDGVKYYKDGTPVPLDDDDSEYRDSDLYGLKGDKKDKEQFYKDWD